MDFNLAVVIIIIDRQTAKFSNYTVVSLAYQRLELRI